MNLSRLIKMTPVTACLIACMVMWAIVQLAYGGSLDEPTNIQLIRFGANILPLSAHAEPWRLLSSAFVHIGLMHLLFNAFALYFFGQVLELILGSLRYFVLFFLSVVSGNLFSLIENWQAVQDGGFVAINAGASGGIMGLGAALLVISIVKPPIAISLNSKNLALVMGLNLIMGFAIDGINNAGHIGGCLVGLLLGAVFSCRAKYGQAVKFLPTYGVMTVAVTISFGFVWQWLFRQVSLGL